VGVSFNDLRVYSKNFILNFAQKSHVYAVRISAFHFHCFGPVYPQFILQCCSHTHTKTFIFPQREVNS
jgi:hypothetical protein